MPKVILGIKLYSLSEAAQLLGVTNNTITKYTHNGRLATTLIGGRKYVSELNLKDFLTKAE